MVRCITSHFFVENYYNMIYSKINSKNKKRKISKNYLKNNIKSAKYTYRNLSVCYADKQILKIIKITPNLFPEYVILKNRKTLIGLSKKVSEKINSQICKYRSTNHQCFVELVAEDCIDKILKCNQINIFNYIKQKYSQTSFYKKEIQIFPYVFISKGCNILFTLMQKLNEIAFDIKIGAKIYKITNEHITLGEIYGLIKYNQNALKLSQNLNINYQNCVFKLIDKLSIIEKKLKVIIKYMQFIACKFNIK